MDGRRHDAESVCWTPDRVRRTRHQLDGPRHRGPGRPACVGPGECEQWGRLPHRHQDSDGGWGYYANPTTVPVPDPDSTALIPSLVAMGMWPTEAPFITAAGDPVRALASFQLTAGTDAGAFVLAGWRGRPRAHVPGRAAMAGVFNPFKAPMGYWRATSTAGSSTTEVSPSKDPRRLPPERPDRRPGRHPGRRWLLAGGLRRRGLQLRGRHLEGYHGGSHLNAPIVGVAAAPDGRGSWLVASDGGVFGLRLPPSKGSHGGSPPERPDRRPGRRPGRSWLLAGGPDGGVFNYGAPPSRDPTRSSSP